MTENTPRTTKFKLPVWTIITSLILALLVGVSFIIPSLLDQSKYKSLAQSKIKDATGYEVNWEGDIGVRLLPLPTATVEGVEVKNGASSIVKMEKVAVRVALAPLFQKKVEVTSINLIKPQITLTTDVNGNPLWKAQKPASSTSPSSEGNQQSSAAPAIQIGKVSIEDGVVNIDNQQTKSKQTISDINIDLGLKSLDGPFDINGGVTWNKIISKFNILVSNIPSADKPTNVKGEIEIPSMGAKAKFNQTITTANALSTNGDLWFAVDDVADAIKASSGKAANLPKGIGKDLSLKTNLNYNGSSFAAQNLSLKTGVLDYTGAIKVTGLDKGASPLVSLDLKSNAKNAANVDLPVKILSDLSANATAQMNDNVLTIQSAQISLDGQAATLAGSIRLPKDKEKLGLNLSLSSPRLDLDDLQKQYATPTESAAQKAATDNQSTKLSVKGFELPFNGNVKANIGSLNVGGREFANVNLDVIANGARVQINTLSLSAFAGTSLAVNGLIGDSVALSGLNLTVNAKTNDAEQLASTLALTLPKTPKPIGAVGLNGKFTGSLQSLGFDATTSIWGFDLTGKGTVGDVIGKPVINQLATRVRHGNTSDAARVFAGGFNPPKSFRGAMDLSSNIAWDKDQYRLSGLTGRIGSTSINGGLTMAMGKKPSINGSLILGAIEMDSNAPTAKGGSSSAAASSSGSARWSREAINTGWMHSFNADLAIQAQSFTQGGWRFDAPKFSFNLNDGVLNIREMSAQMFGGSATLNGTMKSSGANDPISIDGKLAAKNISAQKLHSAVAGVAKDTFTGTLTNFDMKVAANGISPAALVQSLSGAGNLNGQSIVIKGVDAGKLAEAARGSFKPLARAGSLYGSFQEGSTKFDTMKVAFDISSGVVNFTTINVDGPTASINSTGNLNLPRWTIDLNNKMTVKGTDVPDFEFKISGPLDSPLQTGGSIIENYLKQRALKKVEKLIGNELQKRLGDKIGGDAAGLVNGLLGIQKQDTPATTTPSNATQQQQAPASNPVPAASESTPAPASPSTPETSPNDAVNNIVKDPKNIKADDAIKALNGLLGGQ